MIIRKDIFKIGDMVEFIELDPYSSTETEQSITNQYGNGKHKVEKIEAVESNYRGVGHTQFVTIYGDLYSGYWFKPLRKENEK